LELIRRRKRIRIIKKRTNYLPAKYAIGNIRANIMSRQERFLRIGYLRLKSACKNKLMSTRLMGISLWSSLIMRN
jgi:hypothetical protein